MGRIKDSDKFVDEDKSTNSDIELLNIQENLGESVGKYKVKYLDAVIDVTKLNLKGVSIKSINLVKMVNIAKLHKSRIRLSVRIYRYYAIKVVLKKKSSRYRFMYKRKRRIYLNKRQK